MLPVFGAGVATFAGTVPPAHELAEAGMRSVMEWWATSEAVELSAESSMEASFQAGAGVAKALGFETHDIFAAAQAIREVMVELWHRAGLDVIDDSDDEEEPIVATPAEEATAPTPEPKARPTALASETREQAIARADRDFERLIGDQPEGRGAHHE